MNTTIHLNIIYTSIAVIFPDFKEIFGTTAAGNLSSFVIQAMYSLTVQRAGLKEEVIARATKNEGTNPISQYLYF